MTPRHSIIAAMLVGLALTATLAAQEAAMKPADYLATLTPPTVAADSRLLPLTRFGWTLDYDTRVALTEHWGYALEMGGYVTERTLQRLEKPDSIESRVLALAESDPARYPLAVICSRNLPTDVPDTAWTRDADGHFLNGKAQSLDGTQWHQGMKTIWSTEAPDSVWMAAGKLRADPIAELQKRAPIAMVLNGGEYGLGVAGFARKVWQKDPVIVAARGDTPWFEYVSARKANAETLIANEVKAVTPDRRAYIYYPTSGGTHRNKGKNWGDWFYGFEWMKGVSDYASSEHYYMHFNSGWTGKEDMLTQALNAKGFEIAGGVPLSYDWLCAGWTRDKQILTNKPLDDNGLGDLERYEGFLKCKYAMGMIGGNAGYYTHPKGGFGAAFDPAEPPHWLRQMVTLGRVHAQFSHLDRYLFDGDLLPGPDAHRMSPENPAYEFPTGDSEARVLVRRIRGAADWLIVAWAAGGDTREVTVRIPDLGDVQLEARPSGTVYTATLTEQTLTLVERTGSD